MNKLLLQDGLSPVMFDNPNIIAMNSLEEIRVLIQDAQKDFETKLLAYYFQHVGWNASQPVILTRLCLYLN